MPALGQLRKRWHYVSFWSRELSFCAARVSVGPLRQEYWAIWDRAAQEFRERSHMFKRCVLIEPNRLQVNDSDVAIDVTYRSCSSFEVYRPAQRAYIWSHHRVPPGILTMNDHFGQMLAFSDTFSRLKKFLFAIVETTSARSTKPVERQKIRVQIQNLRSYSDASNGYYQG